MVSTVFSTFPTLSDRYDEAAVQANYEHGLWLPQSLPEILDDWVVRQPDKVFVVDGAVELTYEQLRAGAYRLAGRLLDLGVARGDRIVLQLPNWHEFIVCYLAMVRIGVIVVSALPHYRRSELSHIVRQTTPVTMIVGAGYRGHDLLEAARTVRDESPAGPQLIVVRGMPAAGELAYAELVGSADDTDFPDAATLGPAPSPDGAQQIVFTSGTESAPKGCVHTFNTVGVCIRGTGVSSMKRTSADVTLTPMPIGHSAAFAMGVLTPIFVGGSTVLMNEWDPLEALQLIEKHRCTSITAGPPFLRSTLATARENGLDAASLEVWLCGSAPIPTELVEGAARVFKGCRVLTNFGRSESFTITNVRLDDPPEKAAQSDGRVTPGTELKIMRPDGNEAGPGEEGEIFHRGAGIMLGYWADPERTADAFDADGWAKSGDLGKVDADGYLRVTGRLKDLINRGGENVSAQEVEVALQTHPAIARIAAVGVPDETLGERVAAFVLPKPGCVITLDEVREAARDAGLAAFKWPEHLFVVDKLPTTAVGKIKKRELRESLLPQVEPRSEQS